MLFGGVIVALLAIIAVGLLSGSAGRQGAQATGINEVKKLLASDAQANDEIGSSAALSGDTAIIGANRDDGESTNTSVDFGAAYIFQRDEGGAGAWGEVVKLTASDAPIHGRFGFSVALGGDTALVGAIGTEAFQSNAGAVYVFERDEGGADNWGEMRKLTASDAQVNDRFGFSVAVSGDTAVVGAEWEDAGGFRAGAAYIFQRDQGGADNWGEVKKLTASDAQASDLFGFSAAISGDTAFVGAKWEDGGAGDPLVRAGAVYVFERDEGGPDNWGEVRKLTASDAQFDGRFGASAALSGDTAVLGADGDDAGGAPPPAPPTSSSATRVAQATGAR